MNDTARKIAAKDEEDVRDMINEHPLHAVEIANKLQIQVGAVNNAVLSLRSRGLPICGDDAYEGYYYGCPAQVEKTVRDLEWQRDLLDLAIRLMQD